MKFYGCIEDKKNTQNQKNNFLIWTPKKLGMTCVIWNRKTNSAECLFLCVVFWGCLWGSFVDKNIPK